MAQTQTTPPRRASPATQEPSNPDQNPAPKTAPDPEEKTREEHQEELNKLLAKHGFDREKLAAGRESLRFLAEILRGGRLDGTQTRLTKPFCEKYAKALGEIKEVEKRGEMMGKHYISVEEVLSESRKAAAAAGLLLAGMMEEIKSGEGGRPRVVARVVVSDGEGCLSVTAEAEADPRASGAKAIQHAYGIADKMARAKLFGISSAEDVDAEVQAEQAEEERAPAGPRKNRGGGLIPIRVNPKGDTMTDGQKSALEAVGLKPDDKGVWTGKIDPARANKMKNGPMKEWATVEVDEEGSS